MESLVRADSGRSPASGLRALLSPSLLPSCPRVFCPAGHRTKVPDKPDTSFLLWGTCLGHGACFLCCITRPRPTYKNSKAMVTKRVHKRQHLLSDGAEVRHIIEFTLAYCAMKYETELHAIVVQSNHIHRDNLDKAGNRPDFNRDFHSFLARQLNALREESDSFFSSSQPNYVESESSGDVLDRISYIMGNPVKHGVVREGKDYQGLRLRWPQPDRVIKKPKGFFRPESEGGKVPDEVVLRFSRPPGFEGLTDEELDRLLEERILAKEKKEREKRDADGKPFECDVTSEPPDPNSFPTSRHSPFGLAPLIGAKVKEERLAAIKRLKEFRERHREARLRFVAGETDVVFPYGTYQAARRWGALVEPAPT